MMFQSYDFGNETKECLRRPLRGARSNIMGVARGSETRWTANLVLQWARDKPRENFYPCFTIKPLLGACAQLNPFECSGEKDIKVPTFGNGRHF